MVLEHVELQSLSRKVDLLHNWRTRRANRETQKPMVPFMASAISDTTTDLTLTWILGVETYRKASLILMGVLTKKTFGTSIFNVFTFLLRYL